MIIFILMFVFDRVLKMMVVMSGWLVMDRRVI